eukprot:31032-Pelagococcus_subviridis.AAC.5
MSSPIVTISFASFPSTSAMNLAGLPPQRCPLGMSWFSSTTLPASRIALDSTCDPGESTDRAPTRTLFSTVAALIEVHAPMVTCWPMRAAALRMTKDAEGGGGGERRARQRRRRRRGINHSSFGEETSRRVRRASEETRASARARDASARPSAARTHPAASMTTFSMMFVHPATRTAPRSPFKTAPCHTVDEFPTSTSPAIVAFGAIHASTAISFSTWLRVVIARRARATAATAPPWAWDRASALAVASAEARPIVVVVVVAAPRAETGHAAIARSAVARARALRRAIVSSRRGLEGPRGSRRASRARWSGRSIPPDTQAVSAVRCSCSSARSSLAGVSDSRFLPRAGIAALRATSV